MPQELAEKLEAIWSQLDDLALSIGIPTLVRELLARNRDLMRSYDSVLQHQADLHPVTSQVPQASTAAKNGHGEYGGGERT